MALDPKVAQYFNAISVGDLQSCQRLLHSNVNVNCTNKNWTGLLIAVWNGNLPVTKLLLDNRASVNLQQYDGSTPLYIACQKGYHGIIQTLLEFKADVNIRRECGAPPLYIAAQEGKYEAAKLVLQYKADPNAVRKDGSGSFYISCRCNHLNITRLLVENLADVNLVHPRSGSGLFAACQQEYLDLVKYLLTIPQLSINQKSLSDNYPLHVACLKKNIQIVQLLLDNGAVIDTQSSSGEVKFKFLIKKNNKIIIIIKIRQHYILQ